MIKSKIWVKNQFIFLTKKRFCQKNPELLSEIIRKIPNFGKKSQIIIGNPHFLQKKISNFCQKNPEIFSKKSSNL